MLNHVFLGMRDAACSAFERTEIGQIAKSLRPSNQSHRLSATWAVPRCGCGIVSAFGVHDEARVRCDYKHGVQGSQIDEGVLANDKSVASAESIKAAIFLGGG